MTSLSTHVLDATSGRPAAGVPLRLERPDGTSSDAVTDSDGRVAKLADGLAEGVYRLVFDTGAYFAGCGAATFYPQVVVTFAVTGSEQHYHVPLLLSPFAYSTYRGS
jgi:5-hydroxyisourate hydrolase